ncbi:MAG: flagellar assembly protein FliX [Xanthobacteraceae bacterium]
MRVVPAAQSGVSAANSSRRVAGGSGFSLESSGPAKSATAAGAAMGIQSIDALLALQGVEDTTEKRRRFARRGSSALDLLDALKVEILEGRVGLDTLRRLEVTLQALSERSGEHGLDNVLDAIGVRVAVEIAKRRPAAAPAA